MEDVSVSGNVKNMHKKLFLFYSSNVFRQYVLGTKIGKRHNLISLYHSSLRLMAGVSKDSKTEIKVNLFIYTFSVFSRWCLVLASLPVGQNFVKIT